MDYWRFSCEVVGDFCRLLVGCGIRLVVSCSSGVFGAFTRSSVVLRRSRKIWRHPLCAVHLCHSMMVPPPCWIVVAVFSLLYLQTSFVSLWSHSIILTSSGHQTIFFTEDVFFTCGQLQVSVQLEGLGTSLLVLSVHGDLELVSLWTGTLVF